MLEKQKVEILEKEGPETPLLDLSDAAVKALIADIRASCPPPQALPALG